MLLAVRRARLLKAIAAVYGLIPARLKRHFRLLSALATGNGVHFARSPTAGTAGASTPAGRTAGLSRGAAIGTTVGFVLKTFGGEKFLFSGAKYKFGSTVAAG